MRKRSYPCQYLCLGLVFLAVTCCLGRAAEPAGAVENIRILQTADLHGVIRAESAESPGVLCLATVLRQCRSQGDFSGILHVDCGDTCQGSIEAVATRGAIGPAILKGLGVDIWVPGNHELDFGVQRFIELSRSVSPTILCGNLAITLGGEQITFPSWKTVPCGRARIGVIGMTARHLRFWLSGDQIAGVENTSAQEALPGILGELRRLQVDMIVLAIHQGWLEQDTRQVNEVNDIAREFPEIDLILGAHTHRKLPGRRIGLHTWYVQPGQHGEAVAVVDVALDVKKHCVNDIQSHLVPVTPETPPSGDMTECLAQQLATAQGYAETLVTELPEPVPSNGTPGIDCGTAEIISRALARAANADVVFHGRLSDAGLPAGPVRRRDIYRVVPYENGIALADLTLAEIAILVSEQWENRRHYSYNGLWGRSAMIQRDGSVNILPLPGDAADQRLTVALNGYTAAGAGDRFPRLHTLIRQPAANLRYLDTGTRDALEKYLAAPDCDLSPPAVWLNPAD